VRRNRATNVALSRDQVHPCQTVIEQVATGKNVDVFCYFTSITVKNIPAIVITQLTANPGTLKGHF